MSSTNNVANECPQGVQTTRIEIHVRDVTESLKRSPFIRFPWQVYADDPVWVPPLLLERRMHLGKSNPYFEHAEARFFVAYRGARPVGRISAQVDELHLQRYQDGCGFFGMLEAENDSTVMPALFAAAEDWLGSRGMSRVRGPFSLSINDECGLLVDGFDTPPVLMMPHGLPWYGEGVEACGYSSVNELLAYRLDPHEADSRTMRAVLKRYAPRFSVRCINWRDFSRELQILREVFNDAWSDNWGFLPFTEAEFLDMGKQFKLLLDKDLVHIAEVDGRPAAMIVCLPDFNDFIGDLNGRLLPFGWLKLLWRFRRRFPGGARTALMGVRKQYQRGPMGSALAFAVIRALRAALVKRGVHRLELSWILKNNHGMRKIVEDINSVVYKRYRVYEKAL